MIKKSSGLGQQFISFDPKEHDLVGFGTDPQIMDLCRDKINLGHAIMEYGSGAEAIYYASKKTDGFTREVTAENWDRKMQLNIFERSHAKWQANVNAYFDFMLEDDDTIDEIESLCREALNTPPLEGNQPFDLVQILNGAREWLLEQEMTAKGATKGRKTNVWDFLCGNGKNKYKQPTAWIRSKATQFVKYNTPWEKRKK